MPATSTDRHTADVRTVVLLSGGIDSTTAVASFVEQRVRPEALFVAYGQPAEAIEQSASKAIADHYSAPWRQVTVTGICPAKEEILGRNGLLISVAFAALEALSPACIALAIHAGTPYRDCSPEFVRTTQAWLDFHAEGRVQLLAPFLEWDKAEVFTRARELDVPVGLTHSCERGEGCGSCRSCRDREALLAAAG